jgi:hypothetical protein
LRASFVVRASLLLLLAFVPLRIVGQGYRPDDDALRHAAKAVSGRPWSEILVLRPDVTMDSHPGWHAVLGLVHRATGADVDSLVRVSVTAGLLAVLIPPLFLLRRPEAWALVLVAFGTLEPRIVNRFASGRPFLMSAGLLTVLCLLAARSRGEVPARRVIAVLGPAIAIVVWMHPSWHLFLLPVAACLLAGHARTALVLAVALAAGVLAAGVLYGHPVEFVVQSVWHTVLAMGSPAPPGTLAIEFLPGDGSPMLLLGAAALWLWRAGRRRPAGGGLRAVIVLAGLGWLLGWLVIRFWSDWGVVALLVWMTIEVEAALEDATDAEDRRRLAPALVLGAAALLVLSAPFRAARVGDRPYLVLGSPLVEALLPDAGGTVYTDDMRVFYQLFALRPRSPWRYVVGYEPALMPPEDLATLRQVLAARTGPRFEPWVRKMQPADRLILRSLEGTPPIPGLEWAPIGQGVWVGRVSASR